MKWNMSGTNLLFCCPQEVQPCLAKKRLGRGSRKRCLGMFKGEFKEEIGRGSLVKFSWEIVKRMREIGQVELRDEKEWSGFKVC